jgi:class 3 adenylate cyclase
MTAGPHLGADAADHYLLLADISGYTTFLGGVAEAHGEDFSGGLPAGYRVLGELIQGLIDGLPHGFDLVKVEGDAVFAAAPADRFDGLGKTVLGEIGNAYRAFTALRDVLGRTATDDKCDACFLVARLDLKAVLHRGFVVRQSVGRQADVVGPAVNVAHRLLKNSVRERIGHRPYVIVTDAAASKLGVADLGIDHREAYADVGVIESRIVDLAELAGLPTEALTALPAAASAWPEIAS